MDGWIDQPKLIKWRIRAREIGSGVYIAFASAERRGGASEETVHVNQRSGFYTNPDAKY
jgi:hypothetical protein